MIPPAQRLYEFGPFQLNPRDGLLFHQGSLVALSPKTVATLLVLVEHNGTVVHKDELMKAVWPDTFVEEAGLSRNVSVLRKVLAERSPDREYIETVPKRGYRFIAPVRATWEEPSEVVIQRRTTAEMVIEEEENGEEEVCLHELEGRESPELFVRSRPWWRKTMVVGAALMAVGATAAILYLLPLAAPSTKNPAGEVRSLAVLPFESLTKTESDDYLGLGLADALITRLGTLKQLTIRPTSAVRKYSSPSRDAVAVGKELQVGAVLDGNIQRQGDRIRLTVQLVDTQTGSPIWTEQFDEKFADLFSLEDVVTDRLAAAIQLNLTSGEVQRMTRRPTRNVEAYLAYLRGRYLWSKRVPEAYEKALASFQQAITLDRNFALAYAGLADCYFLLNHSNTEPLDAISKALAIDDTVAEAHASLAFYRYCYEWDWNGAEQEFRRAIELKPGYATAHQWYAYELAVTGRLEEALAEIRRAQEIDPISLIINTDIGELLLFRGEYEQAIEQLRRSLELEPNFAVAHRVLGQLYEQVGRYKDALAEFDAAKDLGPSVAGIKAHAYAASGDREMAEKGLAEAKRRWKEMPREWTYVIALIYAGLGEKDKAFEWLERAYQHRAYPLLYLKLDPRFVPLRSDSRYRDLLRRIGLPE